jgi:hypothetical protein
MAQELGLGRLYSDAQLASMGAAERQMVRIKQRMWWVPKVRTYAGSMSSSRILFSICSLISDY